MKFLEPRHETATRIGIVSLKFFGVTKPVILDHSDQVSHCFNFLCWFWKTILMKRDLFHKNPLWICVFCSLLNEFSLCVYLSYVLSCPTDLVALRSFKKKEKTSGRKKENRVKDKSEKKWRKRDERLHGWERLKRPAVTLNILLNPGFGRILERSCQAICWEK